MLVRLSALKEKDKVSRWGRFGVIFLAVALFFLTVAFAVGPWSAHERVNLVYAAVERVLAVIGFLFLALGICCWWKSGYLRRER